MKKSILIVLSIFALLFVSCVSHPQIEADIESYLYPLESYIPENFEWQEVQSGIWRYDFENHEFPIVYHAVKIDLSQPDLEIVSFPDTEFAKEKYPDGNLPKPFIYRSITTAKFAKKYNCTVAVNATPFAGKNGKWDLLAHFTSTRQLVGIHKDNKFEIATPVLNYAALTFSKNSSGYIARVIDLQTEELLADCDFAFGAFYTVLRDGLCNENFIRIHDSRTGCGVSKDGQTLFILVVEGEVQNRSEGLSYPQCAEIFKAMGCDDALEFDGGGSSQLCINGKSVLTYHKARVQGNSFGFIIE